MGEEGKGETEGREEVEGRMGGRKEVEGKMGGKEGREEMKENSNEERERLSSDYEPTVVAMSVT